MALGYYGPLLLKSFGPAEYLQMSGKAWQLFPLSVAVIQYFLARTVFPDTIDHDRIHSVKRDLNTIRKTMGVFIAISTVIWWYTMIQAPVSIFAHFTPESVSKSFTSLEYVRSILQTDQIMTLGTAFLWLGYFFWDLKCAGMVDQGWLTLAVLAMFTSIAAGPGAAIGSAWLWREEILGSKYHKSALTNVGKKGKKVPNGTATNGTIKARNGHAGNGVAKAANSHAKH
jgi:hypothetical protein